MFFHLKSLFYSVLFLSAFELIYLNENLVWFLAAFFLFFSFFAGKRLGEKYSFSVIPMLFSLSSIVLFYLIDFPLEKQIFIIFSSTVFYFILLGIYRLKNYSKDQTAAGVYAGAIMASAFFFYAGFYGIYINFSIPLTILMFAFLAITFILSYHYFSVISKDKKKILNYSLILSMAMAELSWVINFWPFGYLTTGVIALIFYYVFWDMANSYFSRKLSKKRIIVNLIVFSIIIGLILTSSRWQLAV
ncbi:MAG: hypothetical protein V1804_03925 [Patescibacteria group bacterium]